MTILSDIKVLLELDDALEDGTTLYDKQLIRLGNQGIQILINNGVPLTSIETTSEASAIWNEDIMAQYDTIIDWLYLFILQRFDRSLMTTSAATTLNWMNETMTESLYQLKIIFDRTDAL